MAFLIGRGAFFRINGGGAFSYEHTQGTSDVALIGPSLRYFFWTQGQLAAYVGGLGEFGLTSGTINGLFEGSLGAPYFITPSVAFGPWFGIEHVFGRYHNNYDRALVGMDFAIYL